MLKKTKRMYRNLGLSGNFSKDGEARSAWHIGNVLEGLGRSGELGSIMKNREKDWKPWVGLHKWRSTRERERDLEGLSNYCGS